MNWFHRAVVATPKPTQDRAAEITRLEAQRAQLREALSHELQKIVPKETGDAPSD